MLRLFLVGAALILAVAGVGRLLGIEPRPVDSVRVQMRTCDSERRVDNSGRPYTVGPRCERIYDDQELDRIQTRLCLAGQLPPSRCGF